MQNIAPILKKIHALNRFRRLKQAGVSFLIGVSLITLGAILNGPTLPFLILSGFAFVFVSFILVFLSAIQASKKATAYQAIIRDELWQELIAMTSPLKGLQIDHQTFDIKSAFLESFVASPGTLSHTYYHLSYKGLDAYSLEFSHTTSNGKTNASYIDFRGLYGRIKTDLKGPFKIKTDRTPSWFKPLKDKVIPDQDGSLAYTIEGSVPEAVIQTLMRLEDLGYTYVAYSVSNGYFEWALGQPRAFPKFTTHKATLLSNHQAHLKHLINTHEMLKESLKTLENKFV